MASISVATCSTTTVMPMRVSWKEAPGDWRLQMAVAFLQTIAVLARPQVHDVGWLRNPQAQDLDTTGQFAAPPGIDAATGILDTAETVTSAQDRS